MTRIRETGEITAIRENGKTTGYTTAEIDALAESGELDTVRITEVEDRGDKITLADLTPEARAEIMAEARAEARPNAQPFNRIRREVEIREAERERKATPKGQAGGRTSYITEATENILKMAGAELTEGDRAKIAESAGSAVRRIPGPPAVGTLEDRERFVAEATANVLRMAGFADAKGDRTPARSRLNEVAPTREKKGDFVKDATAEILEAAGAGK